MIQQVVNVGSERMIVSAPTLAELLPKVSDLRLLNYRLGRDGQDATFRYRKNDGGDFVEMWSPSLKASLAVSKEMDTSEFYIGRTTPWVRYEKATDTMYVRYNGMDDDVKSLGWTEDDIGKFVKAEKCKTKGKTGVRRYWTFRPLR